MTIGILLSSRKKINKKKINKEQLHFFFTVGKRERENLIRDGCAKIGKTMRKTSLVSSSSSRRSSWGTKWMNRKSNQKDGPMDELPSGWNPFGPRQKSEEGTPEHPPQPELTLDWGRIPFLRLFLRMNSESRTLPSSCRRREHRK